MGILVTTMGVGLSALIGLERPFSLFPGITPSFLMLRLCRPFFT